MNVEENYNNKEKSVPLVYSKSDHLPGHKLRHEVADKLGDNLDIYCSGAGTYTDRFWSQVYQAYLKRKESSLAEHRFQVVIEKVKHPNYVSEKFYDSLKTHTVLIYRGGEESVRKMGFDTDNCRLHGVTLTGRSPPFDVRLPPALVDGDRLREEAS